MPSLPKELPPLREELTLNQSGNDFNHTPTWVLYDPLSNRFFHLGWMEYQILSRWELSDPKAVMESVNSETTLEIDAGDIHQLLQFLSQSCLVQLPSETLAKMEQSTNPNSFIKRMMKVFFIRIPLVNPDRFLRKTLPWVRPLFTKRCVWLMTFLAIISLLLISRQWDNYTATLVNTFTIKGMFALGLTLILTKFCHELGHAYLCKLGGVNVPTMGVALLMGWPVLYTDTTESWQINSNKKRLLIGLGGLWVEAYLAVLATLAWPFLPQGLPQQIAFFIGSVSLLLSLVINASPFMRFDGYHVLSDLLGVRNLQPRSFALARWWLRKTLFGILLPKPESLTPSQTRILLLYAFGTWIYRLFLFVGLALVIYSFVFKALGILLFAAEIVLFIGLPVVREVQAWWKLRKITQSKRNILITASVIAVTLMLLLTPWRTSLNVAAIMENQTQRLFAPVAAQIDQLNISRGDTVKQGQSLLTLHSATLDYQIAQTKQQIIELYASLQHAASTRDQLANHRVLSQQLVQAQTKQQGLLKRKAKLVIRAPFDGIIEDVATGLTRGLWIKRDQMLLSITNPSNTVIEAFVPTASLGDVKANKPITFIPEDLSLPEVTSQIDKIDFQHTRSLATATEEAPRGFLSSSYFIPATAYIASHYGGPLLVRQNKKQELIPEQAIVKLSAIPNKKIKLPHIERGQAVLTTSAHSFAADAIENALAVLIRESGF